jgi:hypothetical protein
MPKRSTSAGPRPATAKNRQPIEREIDNIKSGAAASPRDARQTNAKSSYGPFGRGDREPQRSDKAPHKS